MAKNLTTISIYHITQIANLQAILQMNRLLSDAAMIRQNHNTSPIGDTEIKRRRLHDIQIDCPPYKNVGEFVPFYYCPRSPMLYRINKGGTGLNPGCQKDIVHLVSNVQLATNCGQPWVIADGNAGAYHTSFTDQLAGLHSLNWAAINSRYWSQVMHQKQAEFLVLDYYAWTNITSIGCYDNPAAQKVGAIVRTSAHQPSINKMPGWYF